MKLIEHNGRTGLRRRFLRLVAGIAVSLAFSVPAPSAQANSLLKSFRILDMKAKVFTGDGTVRLKDLASNLKELSEAEQELVIVETPTDKSSEYSLIDVAYMLQRHKELHDVKIRGPRTVVIQKKQNVEFILRAKEAVTNYVSSEEPWKEWETDVLFSNDDELRINKIGEYANVVATPYDNKAMLGTLAFSLNFFDADGKPSGKTIINPVILKRVDVVVMNANVAPGDILQRSGLKQVPMWIGDMKKSYVTDIESCIGKEVAKRMSFGDILMSTDILNPICVKKGDILWIECLHGVLRVRVAATALQNGRLGDYIRVKNRSSNKEFMVELIGPKEARYQIRS
jgi:flagella basal body P-ring formation protein FlgA